MGRLFVRILHKSSDAYGIKFPSPVTSCESHLMFVSLCWQEVLCNSVRQMLLRCAKQSVDRTNSIVIYDDQFAKVWLLVSCMSPCMLHQDVLVLLVGSVNTWELNGNCIFRFWINIASGLECWRRALHSVVLHLCSACTLCVNLANSLVDFSQRYNSHTWWKMHWDPYSACLSSNTKICRIHVIFQEQRLWQVV